MASNSMIAVEDFVDEIHKIYNFGYKTCNEEFRNEFQKWIISRLGMSFKSVRFVNIEDAYVETEWKDMISLHYINTSYASSILPRVIRVHLFSDNSVSENTYIGFVTIRPIEELSISLSYVFLNLNQVSQMLDASNARFVSYKKRVHCMARELHIDTYPILVQDSIVTCCADVNLVTLSRFLSHKYGGRQKTEIKDICKDDYNFSIPRKLKDSYFEGLCIKFHIPYKTREIKRSKILKLEQMPLDEKKKKGVSAIKTREGICRYVNAYLDSNLPVLIHADDHIVQIVGWYNDGHGCIKHIVFDDSGFLYHNKERELNKPGPVFYSIDLKDWLFYREEYDDDDFKRRFTSDYIRFAIPQYDRVYIDYPLYEGLLDNYLDKLWGGESERAVLNPQHKDQTVDLSTRFNLNNSEINHRKSRLVECSKLVMFFAENLQEAKNYREKLNGNDTEVIKYWISILNEVLNIFDRECLPHYIWYTELDGLGDTIVAVCADPTKLYNATHVDNVFYNGMLKGNSKIIPLMKSMWDDTIVR